MFFFFLGYISTHTQHTLYIFHSLHSHRLHIHALSFNGFHGHTQIHTPHRMNTHNIYRIIHYTHTDVITHTHHQTHTSQYTWTNSKKREKISSKRGGKTLNSENQERDRDREKEGGSWGFNSDEFSLRNAVVILSRAFIHFLALSKPSGEARIIS